MGPLPAPELPDWEPFSRRNGFVQIVISEVPCNWLQCQENTIDPVHFEWLHDTWSSACAAKRVDHHRRPTCGSALTSSTTASPTTASARASPKQMSCGRSGVCPVAEMAVYLGGHFEWRVPIDDDARLSIGWFFDRVPHEMEPFRQDRIPYWYGPIKDEATGRWITSHVMNQDFVGWVGQGTVADRTLEHLGESDRGIILLRRRLLEEARKVERGEEPKGLIRNPQDNVCVPLPAVGLAALQNGRPLAEMLAAQRPGRPLGEFAFFAHQPEEIRQAYLKAMGLDRARELNGDRPAVNGTHALPSVAGGG